MSCCHVVDCSFECMTESSDSEHSGVITVRVSGEYSAVSEDEFTFKVDSLLLLSTAVFCRDHIFVKFQHCICCLHKPTQG